jgi:hypothetical protein
VIHEIKCWPEYFGAVADGTKRLELRFDDRGYAVGDALWLREWEPLMQTYSGAEVRARVTHIVRWQSPSLVAGHVAMSIEVIE